MNEPERIATQEDVVRNNVGVDDNQALDDISLADCNEASDDNEGVTGGDDPAEETNVGSGINFSEDTAVNGVEDIGKVDLKNIGLQDMMSYHFPNVDIAFTFYNCYGSFHGFSARKSKKLRNSNGELIQQTFLCHREGRRPERDQSEPPRQREQKPITRCGCKARCVVHIESVTGRWYIKQLSDEHNHTCMEDKYTFMLPAHRKMNEFNKFQMNMMKEVGISTPHILGVFASQAGGYDRVGFLKQDLYNEQNRHGKTLYSDAKAALDFLESLRVNDEMLFWRHTVDQEGRLEHLFWCDGVGRSDFSLFGDVLAFDATYRKNRYMCPLVVFSGVNHHNMSIVFGSGIVANETEETYVWLLEQFVEAMGGKCPVSVITDGDVAMKNAIRRVFPNAHHRLCAWHLIRNATSNVKNANFVSGFKRCMLGDFDVVEFNRRWEKLVEDLGLEENLWVLELYEKRRMWATAYIRGNFFAGFRTTSRCEGLHSEFGKYVNVRNSLLQFLQHYFRWINYMRYREVESDFSSVHGEQVLQTQLERLEKSAARVYTREVFMLFRPVLIRSSTCKVVGIGQDGPCFSYKVCRYGKEGMEWIVTYSELSLEFKCTCKRLESFGIPCEHIIRVLVLLDILNLPETLVLKRWTKNAKQSICANGNGSVPRDPRLWCMYVGLVEHCYNMSRAAYESGNVEEMRKTIDIVRAQESNLRGVARGEPRTSVDLDPPVEEEVRDPARRRSKGCGGASTSSQSRGPKAARKAPTCRACGRKGHKRHVCPVQRQNELAALNEASCSAPYDELEYLEEDPELDNVDMSVG